MPFAVTVDIAKVIRHNPIQGQTLFPVFNASSVSASWPLFALSAAMAMPHPRASRVNT